MSTVCLSPAAPRAVAPRVFTYDANGNTVSDGLRSYEWDAENRLARVRHGDGSVTAFGYDGRGRRVWIEEKDAQGTVTSVRRYVWADGTQPAEERDGANAVLRRFYPEGEQAPGAAGPLNRLFYAKDHLGSVREVTDAAGVLRARYDYGFWGNRTRVSGDVETVVGYTGHHHHGKSGLVLTWYRAYDPDTGRWLSRDPIEEEGGLNLYGYCGNDPARWVDPSGLLQNGAAILARMAVGAGAGAAVGSLGLGIASVPGAIIGAAAALLTMPSTAEAPGFRNDSPQWDGGDDPSDPTPLQNRDNHRREQEEIRRAVDDCLGRGASADLKRQYKNFIHEQKQKAKRKGAQNFCPADFDDLCAAFKAKRNL